MYFVFFLVKIIKDHYYLSRCFHLRLTRYYLNRPRFLHNIISDFTQAACTLPSDHVARVGAAISDAETKCAEAQSSIAS